ncbi:MAG TPA: methyltransferase domain-containing protein, partial [Vicinamibacterales bacterium]|nr:methyltransferase domain-containing protein [Vicinamibacterales bacterium]
MSVATHLAIDLREYDARIRTFIPRYEEMLDVAAATVNGARPRVVVDLGIGTGAFASRVAGRRGVRLIGIDEDEAMLALAGQRLPVRQATLVAGSFLRVPIPPCDAIVSSLALHHVESRDAKRKLYLRAHEALRPRGILVSADCHPSSLPSRAAAGRRAWLDHLTKAYSPREARAYLRTWAREDFYTTIEQEVALMAAAGFRCDVVWRHDSFAVIAGELARL